MLGTSKSRTARLLTAASSTLLLGSLAACGETDEEPETGHTTEIQQPWAEPLGNNVVATAPWRVQGTNTPIPFSVAIVDGLGGLPEFDALKSVEIVRLHSDWKGSGGKDKIYDRDFGSLEFSGAAMQDFGFFMSPSS